MSDTTESEEPAAEQAPSSGEVPPGPVWGRPADWNDFPIRQEPPPPPPRPRPRPPVWLIAGAAVVVVAALVVAIVLATRSSSGRGAVTAAAARTVGGHTAKFTFTAAVTINGQPLALERLEGDLDMAAHNGEFAVTSPPNPSVSGTVRYVGSLAYFHYAGFTLPAGKQWTEVTPADLGSGPEAGRVLVGGDPTSRLQVLTGTVGEPNVIAKETLGGVAVTHYGLQLDLTKFLAQVRASISEISPSLATSFTAAGKGADFQHVAGEVWLDAQGRIRRLDYTVDTSAAAGITSETTSLTFSDFGEAFTVAAPPPGQVVPFAQVHDQLTALLGGKAPA